jgi:hypothetical protein
MLPAVHGSRDAEVFVPPAECPWHVVAAAVAGADARTFAGFNAWKEDVQ